MKIMVIFSLKKPFINRLIVIIVSKCYGVWSDKDIIAKFAILFVMIDVENMSFHLAQV